MGKVKDVRDQKNIEANPHIVYPFICVSFYVLRFHNSAENPLIAIMFTGTVRTNRFTFLGQRISCLNIAKNISFLFFKASLKTIHLAVMLYARFPLSLRILEDLFHEPGIDIN